MHYIRPLRRLCILLVGLSVFLIAGFFATVSAPVTYAHAFVVGSDPIDGSTVASVPGVVRIFFNAPVSSASSAIVLAPVPDQYGQLQVVNAGHSTVSRINPRELDTVLAHAGSLPQGSYEVRWTALADGDGHTTSGIIGFDVGHSSLGLAGQTILGPSTSNDLPQLDLMGVLSVAWDWLVLMALTLWIGILVIERLILEREGQAANLLARIRKHALPMQWLCLSAVLVGEMINLVLRATHFSQTATDGGLSLTVLWQILATSAYGSLWLARIVLLALAMVFLWWTTRTVAGPAQGMNGKRSAAAPARTTRRFSRLRQQAAQEQGTTTTKEAPVTLEAEQDVSALPVLRSPTVFWLVLAALLLLTYALASDAAQLAQPHLSAVLLDWLFLAARSIWLGGLACLGYILLPLLKVAEPDQHAAVLVAVLRRFTPLMLLALGVVLVCGLYLSESSLTGIQQLLTDPYGRVLLVELALGGVLLAPGLFTLFFLRLKMARQMALLPVVNAELPARRARQTALAQTELRVRQSLLAQSWLGAAVLLCTALMTFYAPPIVFPNIDYAAQVRSQSGAPAQTVGVTQTKQVGGLAVTLQVLPARYGYANTLIVSMTDGSSKPVTDAQVQISTNMQVMDMGTTRASIPAGNPTYTATFSPNASTAFSMPGLWDVTLNIQRPGQPVLQTTFQVVFQ